MVRHSMWSGSQDQGLTPVPRPDRLTPVSKTPTTKGDLITNTRPYLNTPIPSQGSSVPSERVHPREKSIPTNPSRLDYGPIGLGWLVGHSGRLLGYPVAWVIKKWIEELEDIDRFKKNYLAGYVGIP